MTQTDDRTSGDGPGGQVQSFVRGLAVIRCFDGEHPRLTLAQVAERTGLARATARRFLHTLVSMDYANTDGTEFWLTSRVLELGHSYLSSLSLPDIGQPRLEELSRRINESSSMSVLEGHDVVYVSRVPVRRIMAVSITIGTRFPAYATSMGRVLLADLNPVDLDSYLDSVALEPLTPRTCTAAGQLRAELQTVRDQGWALVDQELEIGLRSVAAPVRGPDGRTVAAVNVSTRTEVYGIDDLHRDIIPELLAAARAISGDLAAQQL
ncbi:IclR family transcriptional regulator [Corynebacterium sp. CNJ-954]|uniref:IclR family transcriptional regulator domain-containing protein n=1 Tax=Corynebacterium sp. CNJ-954 TaxID=1904962 RepID=UPI00096551FC|nr:IclR family transcriptional regulator C-terminal domain-containing protein [Corynebacterium sp. CNJ-954]OLT51146.1 IclR family transcriptional regulator [Corynebacterium sp. CNJ-954]